MSQGRTLRNNIRKQADLSSDTPIVTQFTNGDEFYAAVSSLSADTMTEADRMLLDQEIDPVAIQTRKFMRAARWVSGLLRELNQIKTELGEAVNELSKQKVDRLDALTRELSEITPGDYE